MGILHYPGHFSLLGCLAAVLAATHGWTPAVGVVAGFGIYGALHASALAATLRVRPPAWRVLRFVAIAASLSMLSAALGMCASRLLGGSMGVAQRAVLLSLSSGIGSASYASVIRRSFGAHLTLSAIATVASGCIAATLVVFLSGFHLERGGLWVAMAWWFAMSLGLWMHDGRWAARQACPKG